MFNELILKSKYVSTKDNLPEVFYNPILRSAIKYDRVSAYFSSKALAMYAEGLECFARKGYKYRLIISKDISEEDYNLIRKGYKVKKAIIDDMLDSLDEELDLIQEKNMSNLAYLIAIGVVEIKIALKKVGIFHDKCGIFRDEKDNIICFSGSENETLAAIRDNYETFQVVCSWIDSNGFYRETIDTSIEEFEKLWNDKHKEIKVLNADEVLINKILTYSKGEIIVDEVFLKENTVVLDYNEQLLMRLNIDGIPKFLTGALYKLTIHPYVERTEGNIIYFKKELTYTDFQKLDKKFRRKFENKGINYEASKRLLEYIDSRNIHIDNRSRLGITIKNHDVSILNQFEKYKEIVDQTMIRKLRNQQMWDSFFMYVMEKVCNFSVPGSGKTASALGVFAFLKSKGIVEKIVMIGPKNSFGSWIDEFNACFGKREELKLFNIHDKKYKNSQQKRRALTYDSYSCNLFLFNYESVPTYEDEIKKLINSKTLLIFDEIHKAKRIEGSIAASVLKVSQNAGYTIAMTGTPIPNSYLDIYNLLHILYNDEYNEFFGFDKSMLAKPSQREKEDINKKLQPFFCRTTKEQLLVPKANEDYFINSDATEKEQKLFDIVSARYSRNKLALFIRILQLESNPRLLLNSIDINEFSDILDENIDDIDSIDFVDYSKDIQSLVSEIDITSKKKACIEYAINLVRDNKKVIIWCIFIDSIKSIGELLKSKGIRVKEIYGEVSLEERLQIIKEFKEGLIDVLITNPHTLAESVSLHTVCHDAIYFEYSYNLVHLLQSKDRIHRLGLPDNQYTQWYFCEAYYKFKESVFSMDDKIYQRLREKENIMLDAIENQELEESTSTQEDLDLIFGDFF